MTDTGRDRPGFVARAEIHETHSSIVALVGDHAFKVKKPVDLGFLDFRTVQSRHDACRHEIELNQRLAPDVYEDLAVVTGSDGQVRDYVIVMRRMPEDLRLSTLTDDGADVTGHLRSVARLMAGFHATAARGPDIAREGTAAGLRRRWSNNLAETEPFCGAILDPALFERIRDLALRYVDGRSVLLAERAAAGLVVDGHGDLIAQDIFCLPDYPRVLDCLEFDDKLRWVDVLDDVAFLAMDVERLGRADLAARFLDWYSEFSGVPVVSSLQEHYIAYRAFVRAKVSCIRAAQGDPSSATDADGFARLALRHLEAGDVRIVLVGGAPGTGKTTVATALAGDLGFAVLSSDTVRRDQSFAPEDRYTPSATEATYRELLSRARLMLEHGESVILDATFGDAASRLAAAAVATETASRLVCLECQSPLELAAARAQRRRAHGRDASEADADVARLLAARREPWPLATPIDTSHDLPEAIGHARATILDDTAVDDTAAQ